MTGRGGPPREVVEASASPSAAPSAGAGSDPPTDAPVPPPTHPAATGADVIAEGFAEYRARFDGITQRARIRFERRQWAEMRADANERLDLYRDMALEVAERLRRALGSRAEDRDVWSAMRTRYWRTVADRPDRELAETFFNSISRRVLVTVGVDPAVEFIRRELDLSPGEGRAAYRSVRVEAGTLDSVRHVLTSQRLRLRFVDLEADAAAIAARIERRLATIRPEPTVRRIDVARAPFFRGMGAYLVGRVVTDAIDLPLALALRHGPDGVVVDAALLDEDALSILFSFTRSYFHVETDHPAELVGFLRSLMPMKPVAELYNAIGHEKHGKTVLYRTILGSLMGTQGAFHRAPGKPGMVMNVFTLDAMDRVFKVIKDTFPPPKAITRGAVRRKYDLVFRHDRAGRLVDAQEYEHLRFPRARFADELLEELLRESGRTVVVEGDDVVIGHAYVERRVTPLDLYLRSAPPGHARAAALDYGQAIKDLAVSNIFPGDMLLKNFGVTRHGRVVFYDYDELALVTECSFRSMPDPGPDDDMAAEPWFGIAEGDVFPEELKAFIGLPRSLRDEFEARHGELFDPGWWNDVRDRLAAGEVIEIFPYAARHRLHQDTPPADLPDPARGR